MKKAILLGNGLNRLTVDYSWGQLLDDLMTRAQVANPIPTKGKPFPLLYEELVQTAIREGGSESDLKKDLADLVLRIGASQLHSKLQGLGVADLLTTNYDYNVELAWQNGIRDVDTTETRYSLFRKKVSDDCAIWHIHGEQARPETIMLGYEQYSAYLQNMRDYVQKGHVSRTLDAVEKRLQDGIDDRSHSWVDCFFNRDLHILGLALDFVEMHLWWLITYRARLRQRRGFKIDNQITYYFPRMIFEQIRPLIQLLQGMGIRLRQVRTNEWQRFYEIALEDIRRA